MEGLISFRMDWLDILAVQETLLQHHSSKASILQCSAFFVVQLSHPYMSCVLSFVTLLTVALQAPLSVGFSRQEYQSGLPCPPPGDLSDSGIEPMSPCGFCIAGGFFTTKPQQEAHTSTRCLRVQLNSDTIHSETESRLHK